MDATYRMAAPTMDVLRRKLRILIVCAPSVDFHSRNVTDSHREFGRSNYISNLPGRRGSYFLPIQTCQSSGLPRVSGTVVKTMIEMAQITAM
jgi:hypothetical protein